MRINSFEVSTSHGKERGSGHVDVAHGQVYSIYLRNHWPDRHCDAEVKVDGKVVGEFRVNALGRVKLERPINDTGCFTFYRADSEVGQKVGAGVEVSERGLIQVRFRPSFPFEREEKTSGAVMRNMSPVADDGALQAFSGEESYGGGQHVNSTKSTRFKAGGQSLSAGVTGLSGHSTQQFTNVAPLVYDLTMETTITLRLVCVDSEPRPVVAVTRSNPTPDVV